MNKTVLFSTDAATLVVFDPALLASRVVGAGGWWSGPSHSVLEVGAGRIALFGLGGDGVYKVRITEQGLTSAESSYATAVITLGIEVESGNVFVGAGECMPGDGIAQPDSSDTTNGAFIAVPPGEYLVAGYSVVWDDAPDWFVEHDQRSSTKLLHGVDGQKEGFGHRYADHARLGCLWAKLNGIADEQTAILFSSMAGLPH